MLNNRGCGVRELGLEYLQSFPQIVVVGKDPDANIWLSNLSANNPCASTAEVGARVSHRRVKIQNFRMKSALLDILGFSTARTAGPDPHVRRFQVPVEAAMAGQLLHRCSNLQRRLDGTRIAEGTASEDLEIPLSIPLCPTTSFHGVAIIRINPGW